MWPLSDDTALFWEVTTLSSKTSNEIVLFDILSAKMRRVEHIDLKLVQRMNISFAVKLGWSLHHTRECLQQVYGQRTLSKCRIRFWHDQFTNGRTLLVDQHRAHKRRTSRTPANIQAVKTLVEADHRMTILEMYQCLGISESTIQRILKKDLHLVRHSAKLLPAFLTPNHLRQRLQCAQLMLRHIQRTPGVLKKIVTMDKSWVYQYDPETKMQSSQWLAKEDPRPVHCRRPRAIGKCLVITFFDWKGMVHFEFLRNRMINTKYFVQILGRLRTAMRTKRPRTRYYIHMDNASPHTACLTYLYLLLTGQRILEHPPNSPDLMPSDFWLYSCIKRGLKGCRFTDLDELEEAVSGQIGGITAEEYGHCILKSWPMRWSRCVF